MTQLSLFDDGSRPLLDDSTGRITLSLQVVSQPLSTLWFESLRNEVAWQKGRRLMYERRVEVPRLYAHFMANDPDLPPVLHDALAVASRLLAAPLTASGSISTAITATAWRRTTTGLTSSCAVNQSPCSHSARHAG